MSSDLPAALFVTGTDTDCGKTLVASAVIHAYRALGYRVLGMKPVASGSRLVGGELINEDVQWLRRAANVDVPIETMNPYRFEPAISPHFAAHQAGVQISKDKILAAFKHCQEAADIVVVEGAGGWHVPLSVDLDIAGLAKAMNIPVLLVSGLRLGCINHTLLSLDAIRASGCGTAGWVANLVDRNYSLIKETLASIQARNPAPLIANIPWLPEPAPEGLAEAIDLSQLSRV